MTPEQRQWLEGYLGIKDNIPYSSVRLGQKGSEAIAAALAEIDRLTAEVARLSDPGKMVESARARFIEGGIELKHWAVKLVAWSFKDSLGDAENYISINVTPEGSEPLLVTVERAWKKTRAERIAELEAEVAKWRHLYESQHFPKHDGFMPELEAS